MQMQVEEGRWFDGGGGSRKDVGSTQAKAVMQQREGEILAELRS